MDSSPPYSPDEYMYTICKVRGQTSYLRLDHMDLRIILCDNARQTHILLLMERQEQPPLGDVAQNSFVSLHKTYFFPLKSTRKCDAGGVTLNFTRNRDGLEYYYYKFIGKNISKHDEYKKRRTEGKGIVWIMGPPHEVYREGQRHDHFTNP